MTTKFEEKYNGVMALTEDELTTEIINDLIDTADSKDDFSHIEKFQRLLIGLRFKKLEEDGIKICTKGK